MAHNFQTTGTYYVSKAGSDSNAGTSPDAPKLTIQAMITAAPVDNTSRTIVIGTGYYVEAITIGARNLAIVADGFVVIDLGAGSYSINNTSSLTGVVLINGTFTKAGTASNSVTNCLINCNRAGSTSAVISYNSCVLLNSVDSSTSGSNSFNRCTFINSSTNINTTTITNSIATSGSNLIVSASTTAANFNYNCLYNNGIRVNTSATATSGVIQDVNGNYYDLSLASGGIGTSLLPYGRAECAFVYFYLAQHKTAYPALNVNSFSADPLFNNATYSDFSLKYNSPCLKSGSGAVNIGSKNANISFYAGVDFSSVDSIYTNVSGTTDLVISSGTSCTIETKWMPYSPGVLKAIGIPVYVGSIKHNKSASGGSANNNNVPDAEVFTNNTSVQGGNPDRLVIELAWYTGSGTPTVLSDADNGGFATAGTYSKFMINQQVSFSAVTGLPNGHPAWMSSQAQLIPAATYVKAKITLTNTYL